jgi:hypothetical protein
LHFESNLGSFASNELGDRYYENNATKQMEIFTKTNYKSPIVKRFGDLQMHNVNKRQMHGRNRLVNANFNFFKSKAGLNFEIDSNALYFSYAK